MRKTKARSLFAVATLASEPDCGCRACSDLHRSFTILAANPEIRSARSIRESWRKARTATFTARLRRAEATTLGTVFKITAQGALTVLYNFDGPHGKFPYGGLTLGTDGNLYGTTSTGGSSNLGVVFKITPAGALTVLHNFASGDGYSAYAAPIQGADGNFYGTAIFGGASDYGTVYKMTPAGTLTVLHSFDLTNGRNPFRSPGTRERWKFLWDGVRRSGGQRIWHGLQGHQQGKVHDTACLHLERWGKSLCGASPGERWQLLRNDFQRRKRRIWRSVQDHPRRVRLTVLHSFTPASDGGTPYGGLVQATDGNFYGVGYVGGTPNHGTIFRITPGGTFSTRYSFDGTKGGSPMVTLLQHTTGILYGDANTGGTHNTGVFYSLKASLAPYAALLPTSGKVAKVDWHSGSGIQQCHRSLLQRDRGQDQDRRQTLS